MNTQTPEITKAEVEKALSICTEQILGILPEFTDKFPTAASLNLFYDKTDNLGWTNGFWTGEIWLAYEFCKDERLKKAALVQCDSFYERIVRKIAVESHDMGFLYTLSCVAAYKLTENEKTREAALLAAKQLIRMYREKGEFIQSLNQPDCQEENRTIVDCLMNLPILYWASQETGDSIYYDIALKHFLTSEKLLMREDGATAQAAMFDVTTGTHLYNFTRQGYSDDSAWSRGQAWAIYGPAITYRYTKCEKAVGMFRRAVDYFFAHLPEDLVPYFDLRITEGTDWPRDASAGAIAACGMLEMAKYLEKEEAAYYVSWAKRLLKALYDNCQVLDFEHSNGLLLHSTYCCMTPYNRMDRDIGKDECCLFGDYFYLEGMMRLYKEWDMYW